MPTDVQTILNLTVPVVVQIGRQKFPLQQILALGPGAILELDRSATEDLTLLINNKPIGTGKAVKVAENFGIRINSVGSPQLRVTALGA